MHTAPGTFPSYKAERHDINKMCSCITHAPYLPCNYCQKCTQLQGHPHPTEQRGVILTRCVRALHMPHTCCTVIVRNAHNSRDTRILQSTEAWYNKMCSCITDAPISAVQVFSEIQAAKGTSPSYRTERHDIRCVHATQMPWSFGNRKAKPSMSYTFTIIPFHYERHVVWFCYI